jgi:hypothetical protein
MVSTSARAAPFIERIDVPNLPGTGFGFSFVDVIAAQR